MSGRNLATFIVVAIIAVSGLAFYAVANRGNVHDATLTKPELPTTNQTNEKRTIETATPTIAGATYRTPASSIVASHDEWPSEAFADNASAVLKKLKASDAPIHSDELAQYFDDEFVLTVYSQPGKTVYSDETIVAVCASDRTSSNNPKVKHTGRDAVSLFIQSLRPTSQLIDAEVRLLKIITVELSGNLATTQVRCESVSKSNPTRHQLVQNWRCTWSLESTAPKMVSAAILSHDLVESTKPEWFVDRTVDIVGRTDAYRDQLQYGLQYWLARIETGHGMNYFSKHGLAIADVNGDGRDDLFVCQPAGLPNRLFLQNENGTVVDASAEFNLDLLDKTTAALFVDLDNDGDQDLALSTIMGVQIYENSVNKQFLHRVNMRLNDVDLQGISAADYDNDGDLDLYQIVDYATDASRSRQGLPSFVYHNANDGGSNRLLRNDIAGTKWSFADVTDQVGLDVNNQRHSLAAAWEDYDDDGDLDLYVANDYGQNCLYRNDNGRFTDVAALVGVTDFGSGMSVAWGDYDRDQRSDLYVSNMFSSAGNRITNQSQFLPNISEDGRKLYKRFAKGNSLFRYSSDGEFEETGGNLNVEIARWAWGSQFADINNDGWEDILVANGYITTPDTGDL